MDARVDGVPVTARAGKPVDVNALWINGLAVVAGLTEQSGQGRCVVPRPGGDDARLRPYQLLAVSLPHAPLRDPGVVRACTPLLTSLGLRSLDATDPGYLGRHRGGPAERDRAYHQGTVWPWLLGPYAEASLRTGLDAGGLLDGLEAHLSEWGLGSVSETADGDAPHGATGCPFQAWSVAELLRARRLLSAVGTAE